MAKYIERECQRHGLTRWRYETAPTATNRWRCVKCSTEYRKRGRRKIKATLVHEHGGHCQICGYHRCFNALEFHHLDPATKSFTVMKNQASIGLDAMRQEALKCVLLCANCHREVEAGLIDAGLLCRQGPPGFEPGYDVGSTPTPAVI